MIFPRYELKADKSLTVFEFTSIGNKGEIAKIVQYSETNFMKIKELNESKLPIVKIEKSLDEYKDKVLFKEKVEKANETLEKIGLPETVKKQKELV